MVHKVNVSPAETLEQRTASTAGGGTALSTTAALISIPLFSKYLSLTPRDFNVAVVCQYSLNPFLTIITTTDALAGTAEHGFTGFTDAIEPTSLSEFGTQNISDEMQDGDSEDFDINSFDTIANDNALYVGSPLPFRGVDIKLNNKNDVASVLTVNYWDGGAWADTSNADGTDDGGDTFKQDGSVTWAVPSGWKADSLQNIGDTTVREAWSTVGLYWTRWEFSVALDSTVDLVQMRPLNRSTAYAELLEGQEREMSLHNRQFACVEALVNAGDGNLVVNVDAVANERFR